MHIADPLASMETPLVASIRDTHAKLAELGVVPTAEVYPEAFNDVSDLPRVPIGLKVQKILTKQIEDAAHLNLMISATPPDARRLRSVAKKNASAWLTAIPSDARLRLTDCEFRSMPDFGWVFRYMTLCRILCL